MTGRSLTSRLLLAVMMLGLSVAGCSSVRVTLNTPLTQNDVAFIVPGHTTLTDVTHKLGAPDSIAETAGGGVATYRFLDVRYSRLNFGWLAKPWSPVDPDLIFSRAGLGTDAFQVLYDSRGVVTQHSFLRHSSNPQFTPNPF